MSTQLILLVGTNPLPVWVAWEHLKDLLSPISGVLLVHTKNTEDEAERLRKHIPMKSDLKQSLSTEPGNPRDISRKVGGFLKDIPETVQSIHVHYTGGTKVMAVYTVATVEGYAQDRKIEVQTSYLDPRDGRGPKIIDRNGHELVIDPRKGIQPRLGRIADLNGFQIGPFDHFYRGGMERCLAPSHLSDLQLQAGASLLNQLTNETKRKCFLSTFLNRDSEWNKLFGHKDKFVAPSSQTLFSTSKGGWEESVLPLINQLLPTCRWDVKECQMKYEPRSSKEGELEEMARFFKGRWLEYAAYDALKKALDQIARGNSDRSNYEMFHSVNVRRVYKDKENQKTAKPFELDVVAILGYQILVISCGMQGEQEAVKKKGMEVITRARQLGGAEARAIMLCKADEQAAKDMEEELFDEIGSSDRPLKVWGFKTWGKLETRLKDYLTNELIWV